MMNYLSKKHDIRTFSVSPENFTGEKGKGGMATEGTGARCARELGLGWKVSPSVDIQPGEVFTMAEIQAIDRFYCNTVCREMQFSQELFASQQIVDTFSLCSDKDIPPAVLAHTVNGVGNQSLSCCNLPQHLTFPLIKQFYAFALCSDQYGSILTFREASDRIGSMNCPER